MKMKKKERIKREKKNEGRRLKKKDKRNEMKQKLKGEGTIEGIRKDENRRIEREKSSHSPALFVNYSRKTMMGNDGRRERERESHVGQGS